MIVSQIINARRRDHPGLWTVRLDTGRIAAIEPQDARRSGKSTQAGLVDADDGLITPSLVDAHLHLDRVHTLSLCGQNTSGTLSEAISAWSRMKREITPADACARAVRAIRSEIGYGSSMLRVQVDVSSAAGLRLCEGVLAAREQTRNECKIQIVAFPQDGLVCDPGAADNVRRALKLGADVIGGIPQVESGERDGIRHLETLFDLAAELNTTVDVHIDETDEPDSRYAEHLAAMTIERGWQGRVVASHVCALASYPDADAKRVISQLAEARINVVVNPAANLYRQGRGDRHPKRRGLTRVTELLDAGVLCASGQDSIEDVFYPLGNGQLLDQAFMLVHAAHMTGDERMKQAYETVCCRAGDVIGVGCHRVKVDAAANLAVHQAENLPELLRLRPRPRAVLHGGRLVGGALRDGDGPGSA